MNCAFYTLGCKLNQCESEALASSFRSQGFSIVTHQDEASFYFINTCTVTSKAEQKVRRMIRLLSRNHPDSVVIVTGCYAQLNSEELEALGANVLLVSHDNKDILLDLGEFLVLNGVADRDFVSLYQTVRTFITTRSGEIPAEQTRFRYTVDEFTYHTRAFLKIQDGCNNRCTYCRVPLARGNSVSLEYEEVKKRVEHLMTQGYGEVVLTGVNISSYKSEGKGLTELLKGLIPVVSGRGRIRLSSIEPDYVDDEFIKVVQCREICPHFHLPVQSASDSVLAGMKRRYRSETLHKAVSLITEAFESPFLAADVIVGFPGESDDDFEDTRKFLASYPFVHLHVFPYSPRPGTAAVEFGAKVPESVSRTRAASLRGLSENWEEQYFCQWDGKEVSVVIEKEIIAEGLELYSGITHNYLRVVVSKGDNVGPGDTVTGRIRYDKVLKRYFVDVFQ